MKHILILTSLSLATLVGCHHGDDCFSWGRHRKSYPGPPADRPFPVGQVTDAHWETQQTNAEAADFLFYDHEFRYDTKSRVDTAELAPGGKKHLMQVALRLEHVPFPVVIEQSPNNSRPELDQARRQMIIEQLARLGVENVEERVVVANAFPEGYTGMEAENAYYNVLSNSFGGGAGRRFGGTGGAYR
jgi:hypothetical protein